MTNKKWKYFLFATIQEQRVDFKQMKQITGEKLSLASNDEVIDIIHCIPWYVAPFWFDETISTIIDSSIFNHELYLFSPWITTETIELNPQYLKILFPNDYIYIWQ